MDPLGMFDHQNPQSQLMFETQIHLLFLCLFLKNKCNFIHGGLPHGFRTGFQACDA